MTRPLIGITSYREPATWGIWRGVEADLVPGAYPRAVQAAGGLPVILPVILPVAEDRADDAEALVGQLDALLLAGGNDVNPARYGETPHPRTMGVRDNRDGWEIALLRAAYARDLPVLGVCRGMQLMAVQAGGRLVQDLEAELGDAGHTVSAGAYCPVVVQTAPGSAVADLLGDTVAARCHHHQAVLTHPGFVATAWSGQAVEAIESPADRFRIGVQWHPEESDHSGLFQGLVNACR